jgi:hypothetical protein
MERMDCKRLGVDKTNSGASIFKEPPVFIDPKIEVNSNPNRANDFYHQKFPQLDSINKSAEVKELREFIVYAPDSIFDNEISSYFDLDEIIDWHILLLFTHNSDGCKKGFYLYRRDINQPYRLALWDYDHSFGRDTDGEPHLPGIIDWERNTLLNRLVNSNTQGYKQRLKTRYAELKETGILTKENLVSMINKDYQMLKEFAKKNEQLWPVNAEPFYDDANFEDEIKSIKKWIPEQLKVVDEYLDEI